MIFTLHCITLSSLEINLEKPISSWCCLYGVFDTCLWVRSVLWALFALVLHVWHGGRWEKLQTVSRLLCQRFEWREKTYAEVSLFHESSGEQQLVCVPLWGTLSSLCPHLCRSSYWLRVKWAILILVSRWIWSVPSRKATTTRSWTPLAIFPSSLTRASSTRWLRRCGMMTICLSHY